MLKTKDMPHRSPSYTGHMHEGGIVRIETLRQSCDPDATGTLTISAIQSNIVKVEFVEGGAVAPEKSLVVLRDDVEGTFTVTETEAELHLLTSRIQVTVDKRTCALSYRDVNGTPRDNLWLRESPDGGKRLTPIDIERVIYDEDAESTVEDSVDGLKVRTAAIGTVKDRDGFRAAHSFLLQEDEAVYGLGQHEEGFLNYRHRQQFLYQQNMKVAMPVMVSTKGYGIYWDTLALMTFNDLCEETEVTIDAASSLRYYFIAGPAFDQIPEGNQDPGYRELYLRWLQASVFLPIFRSHGTDTAREVWRFGKPGEPYYDAIKASIELRYRLLPYLYSLAGWECQRGYTTFRNLAFDFREDPETHDIADQFMCGPSLMVCPVLAPQEYGPDSAPIVDAPKQRKVYLPTCHDKGAFWYDFHTYKRYEGGEWIDVDTPINRIPVFAPAGSIVPLGPVVRHASESCDAPWVLHVFPGADGSFDIYEDAGDGYGYEQGEYTWQHLTWDDAKADLTVHPVQGSYPSMVERKFETMVVTSEGWE